MQADRQTDSQTYIRKDMLIAIHCTATVDEVTIPLFSLSLFLTTSIWAYKNKVYFAIAVDCCEINITRH